MRLGLCVAHNFGSYKSLEIDFSAPGLSLIYGPTGSGKSTLPDLACWALYGITAKNGGVEDVRAWQTPDEPTSVALYVYTTGSLIRVNRVRGRQAQNDLYWMEQGDEVPKRGKDLKDTQRLLNERLGVDSSLYLTAAYFSEFSSSANFFLNNSKDRRAILERVANLDLPARLAEKASSTRKTKRTELEKEENVLAKITGQVEYLRLSINRAERDCTEWTKSQQLKIQQIKSKAESFDKDIRDKISVKLSQRGHLLIDLLDTGAHHAAIEELNQNINRLPPESCPTCGKNNPVRKNDLIERRRYIEDELKKLEDKRKESNRLKEEIYELEKLPNHYQDQLSSEINTCNPHVEALDRDTKELDRAIYNEAHAAAQVTRLSRDISNLSQLYDLSFNLRGELLNKAVAEVEQSTNNYLEAHFDSEIKVTFSLDADTLEVAIQKSSYDCSYSQLSKGQRGLLKLAFVLSVMEAASNKAGVHFDNVFLDEALDGLDSELKVKAFGLLEHLASVHASVYVIDHSPELQQLFTNKLRVYLDGDNSVIEHE